MEYRGIWAIVAKVWLMWDDWKTDRRVRAIKRKIDRQRKRRKEELEADE